MRSLELGFADARGVTLKAKRAHKRLGVKKAQIKPCNKVRFNNLVRKIGPGRFSDTLVKKITLKPVKTTK